MKKIISTLILPFWIILSFLACEKKTYSFGDIVTPTNLSLTTTIVGATTEKPTGDGSGKVFISAKATGALSYKIFFGNTGNDSLMVSSGDTSFTYNTPDTNQYTVTVNAIGTGGTMSSLSKKIKVYTAFKVPAYIVTALTNNSSKVWITAKDLPAHVGVGPANTFYPDWYAATPNQRDACLYDDEITFTKDASGNLFINVDNKGSSFIISAARPYYGLSAGGDACMSITTAGAKKLTFANSNSGSTSANSTTIQFSVPGNGIVNFATGGTTYEILSISDSQLSLRNIGVDGNAWYQILKTK